MLGPIFLTTGSASGLGALTAGFVIALSPAFAFATPTGSPASPIIYASGMLRNRDFRRAGFLMTVASLALLLALASWYWPLLRDLAR